MPNEHELSLEDVGLLRAPSLRVAAAARADLIGLVEQVLRCARSVTASLSYSRGPWLSGAASRAPPWATFHFSLESANSFRFRAESWPSSCCSEPLPGAASESPRGGPSGGGREFLVLQPRRFQAGLEALLGAPAFGATRVRWRWGRRVQLHGVDITLRVAEPLRQCRLSDPYLPSEAARAERRRPHHALTIVDFE